MHRDAFLKHRRRIARGKPTWRCVGAPWRGQATAMMRESSLIASPTKLQLEKMCLSHRRIKLRGRCRTGLLIGPPQPVKHVPALSQRKPLLRQSLSLPLSLSSSPSPRITPLLHLCRTKHLPLFSSSLTGNTTVALMCLAPSTFTSQDYISGMLTNFHPVIDRRPYADLPSRPPLESFDQLN